jgi:hypothetical protein
MQQLGRRQLHSPPGHTHSAIPKVHAALAMKAYMSHKTMGLVLITGQRTAGVSFLKALRVLMNHKNPEPNIGRDTSQQDTTFILKS